MTELRRYELGVSEWDALIAFQEILQVYNTNLIFQLTTR